MHVVNTVPFFVRVDCTAHSRHRSPEGVYQVEVSSVTTIMQQVSAAVQIVREHVAFLDENLEKTSFKVFSEDGHEVRVPLLMDVEDYDNGSFCGRALEYPDNITLQ